MLALSSDVTPELSMRIATLSILLALSALPLAAHADDLVAGSSFAFTMAQYDTITNSFVTYNSSTLTPGGTTTFSFAAANGTATETHTALANGYDSFTFTFTADSDFFPQYVPGDDYEGLIGIEDLQFDTPFNPTSAILTFSSPSGVITFADGSMADQDFVEFLSDPFDGNFVAGGDLSGYDMIGGQNTTTVVLQFDDTPIPLTPNSPTPPAAATPEPSSLILLATGLLGVATTARRRFVQP